MRFSATIVTFMPDEALLARALASLGRSILEARAAGRLTEAHVHVVDNGPNEALARVERAARAFPTTAGAIAVLHGHGNLGYARANNLVLPRLGSDCHLIMNPDVELDPGAIAAAIAALEADGGIGAVAPAVRDANGERQYLCKRYPSVWVLFLRGLAPAFLRRRFARALDDYEMRDLEPDRASQVPLASGCFLLVRTPVFAKLRGFDPRFFMYFEDYDLSLRIGEEARVAYVPQARIVHHGGGASKKGVRHVAWFVRSACRFFRIHGWKFA
jgi:GT2 family glycosyltransferase